MQQGDGRAGSVGQANLEAGSVHEERAGELDVVESSGEFAALAIHIGLHVGDAVVGLFPSQVLEGEVHLSRAPSPATPTVLGWGAVDPTSETSVPELLGSLATNGLGLD